MEVNNYENTLFKNLKMIIRQTKDAVATQVNSALTMMYWKIGKTINDDVLKNERGKYGEQVVKKIALRLVEEFGSSYSEKNLRKMMRFALIFNEKQIVVSLMRQLSWTHFTIIIPIEDPLKRDFYIEFCKIEKWSVRTLKEKINSLLYERTAISKKPDELARKELDLLKNEQKMSPNLVFRDPYVLDFFGIKRCFF